MKTISESYENGPPGEGGAAGGVEPRSAGAASGDLSTGLWPHEPPFVAALYPSKMLPQRQILGRQIATRVSLCDPFGHHLIINKFDFV